MTTNNIAEEGYQLFKRYDDSLVLESLETFLSSRLSPWGSEDLAIGRYGQKVTIFDRRKGVLYRTRLDPDTRQITFMKVESLPSHLLDEFLFNAEGDYVLGSPDSLLVSDDESKDVYRRLRIQNIDFYDWALSEFDRLKVTE